MTHEGNINKFPDGFYWGAASASHQVEGNLTNNWTEWEHSEKRYKELEQQGLIAKHGLETYISGKATDHYNRYEEDFKLAKELGHNATRFSIEWSRIEPEEGKFNQEEIDHYKEVVAYLRKLGIEPFVTLWHWSIPLWLTHKGGWENKETIHYFERYVRKVVKQIDGVKFWITLNEPEVNTAASFLTSTWPPQKHNILTTLKVYHNLIAGHKLAYKVIKSVNGEAQVGIAKQNAALEAYKNHFLDRIARNVLHWAWNHYFLDRINDYQDFIGLNYYFRYIVHLFKLDASKILASVGKKFAPLGIYDLLVDLKRYNKPIYITENGIPDAQDKYRTWYLHEAIHHVHRAIEAGADVRGYTYWSLTDNFEWHKGTRPRFGLVKIDYENNLERKIRKSAYFYKSICENNGITEDMLKKFNVQKPV